MNEEGITQRFFDVDALEHAADLAEMASANIQLRDLAVAQRECEMEFGRTARKVAGDAARRHDFVAAGFDAEHFILRVIFLRGFRNPGTDRVATDVIVVFIMHVRVGRELRGCSFGVEGIRGSDVGGDGNGKFHNVK